MRHDIAYGLLLILGLGILLFIVTRARRKPRSGKTERIDLFQDRDS